MGWMRRRRSRRRERWKLKEGEKEGGRRGERIVFFNFFTSKNNMIKL